MRSNKAPDRQHLSTVSTPQDGAVASRPPLASLLRALREARGVTQDGWAARLGMGRTTVQRWERGETLPDAAGETALLAVCRDEGLFRPFAQGPLTGQMLTPEALRDLLATARLSEHGLMPAATATEARPARDEPEPIPQPPAPAPPADRSWSPRGLPTGTITFLFTDVEGSTRLWETHAAQMRG